jgi:hypothetical protein
VWQELVCLCLLRRCLLWACLRLCLRLLLRLLLRCRLWATVACWVVVVCLGWVVVA